MKISGSLGFVLFLAAAVVGTLPVLHAQDLSVSHRTALVAVQWWPAGAPVSAKRTEPDLLLAGLDAVWQNTVDRRLILSIESTVDLGLGVNARRADDAPLGSLLLRLYGVTQDRRYYEAATRLDQQLTATAQPPIWQSPFLAEYAATFHHSEAFARITTRLEESKQGSARTLAWNLWSLAGSLPFYASDDPGRTRLLTLLAREVRTASSTQDPSTGLWFDHSSYPPGPDLTASSLMVYALSRSVLLGYLPLSDLAPAELAWKTLLGYPFPNSDIDPQQTGAFLLASTEMENARNARLGRGQKVVVDAWFNSQMHADPAGQQIYFHYKWDDQSNNGYSLLGHIFGNFGAELGTLYMAPTAANMRDAKVYIIASPDIPAKNPHPHYVQPEDGAELAAWVKDGGMLVLLANDPANTDLNGFNRIAERFGMHFNSVLEKHAIGDQYELGKIAVAGGGAIFHDPHTLFMKDVCTIAVTAPAATALSENGQVLMATAKYGKGTVFAAVDPWIYNEYTDGRKLPALYDNYAGGVELVRWILKQIPHVAANGTGKNRSTMPAR